MSVINAITSFSIDVWIRTLEIVQKPTEIKSMLWILLPLLSTLFLMQLYFGRYKKEQLGWNSAVSNSIVLFFVSFNLLGFLYANKMLIFLTNPVNIELAFAKSFIAIAILFESFVLMNLNFFHMLKGKFAFELSSPLILNYIGLMGIILIYSNIPLNWVTFVAILFIFILFVIFFTLLKIAIPPAEKKENGLRRIAKKEDLGRY